MLRNFSFDSQKSNFLNPTEIQYYLARFEYVYMYVKFLNICQSI